MPALQPPVLSLAAAYKALSQQRMEAYAIPADRDEVDRVARYLWNMALAGALQSSVHVFEVTLRNAIYNASVKLIDTTALRMPDVPCWLDAHHSTLLYPQEAADVQRAKTWLSPDPKRRTPGHLIAKLSLGFWVQIMSRVYNELRADGPKLWPRGLPLVFPYRWPQQIREFRNRIAHHEPIWDRDIGAAYDSLLEILGWMSPKMEKAVTTLDSFPHVLAGGTAAYRPQAELLLLGRP